jgi:ATP-dependent metalloprotease
LLRAGYPDIVIERMESDKFATDEECLQVYVQALARTDQADKILHKLAKFGQVQGETIHADGHAIPVSTIVQAALGSKGKTINVMESSATGQRPQPIHVVVEESRGPIFWRFARSITVAAIYGFVILTVVGITMEGSGLLKAGPQQSEVEPSQSKTVKFSDVQGCDEAKEDLEELVSFLRNPEQYKQVGGRMPKGILLTGPPGTGKTLLARAVAGEAGVPFFFMSGSEFDEMYVGVGARRVRELFAAARRKAPSIIFIDELDAIGSKRNPKDQAYMKQTLNQLLVELDGFSQTEGVIIMAATNFPELLDKALVRPGRFDRHVSVPLPDVRGRVQILKLHSKNISLAANLDLSVIARGTPHFSGADLQNLVNQAAIQASKEGARAVTLKHLEFAKDKIIMGAERRSAFVTEESKRITAYHEAGHALVAYYTPGAMPLHKATIMPRGQSLGMTVQLPEMDKDSYTKREYLAMLDVCMGGRVAEELVLGDMDITAGAHNDIMKATDLAKQIVTKFGMSDKVGPVAHHDDDLHQLSTPSKTIIEGEIKAFVHSAKDRAVMLIKSHKMELDRLAKALLDYETLNQQEIEFAIKGKPIR